MNNKKRLYVSLDCSRNGVLKVSALKKYVDYIGKMGYNALMLYLEDVYEIDEEPLFGAFRGKYTKKELQEINNYAMKNGIELIFNIQTLAHLNQLFIWNEYDSIHDIDDILLADNDRTYKLIESMIKSIRECCSSDVLHIGMDEAAHLGLGKYLKKYGYCDKQEIMSQHMKKVQEIANKYGFKSIIDSDMFFSIVSPGYYAKPEQITDMITKLVPNDMEIMFWNYYGNDREFYDMMFEAHKKFNRPVWFLGGAWTWSGFTPNNKLSIIRSEAALKAFKDSDALHAGIACFGDNGAETSYFSVLPALFSFAENYRGNFDKESIKEKFKSIFGIEFDNFLKLDLPAEIPGFIPKGEAKNPDKFMFYNDPFLGIRDFLAYKCPEGSEKFKIYAEELKNTDGGEFNYLFDTAEALCRVMSVKYDLGYRTREAYKKDDKKGLRIISKDYELCIQLLEVFSRKFRERWMHENKAFGYEIIDIRFGGLKERLNHCHERLNDYIEGKINHIEELEEDIHFEDENLRCNEWRKIVSTNVI